MFNELILVITLLVSSMIPAAMQEKEQQVAEIVQLPPAREIPGLTIPDQFPRACVDCHVNYPDMNLDSRLSTVMGGWRVEVEAEVLEIARTVARTDTALTGRHPAVDRALTDIPNGCLDCHSDSRNPVPLRQVLHKLHLAENSVFLRVFRGECTHCHKLDANTGTWQVPSSPEN